MRLRKKSENKRKDFTIQSMATFIGSLVFALGHLFRNDKVEIGSRSLQLFEDNNATARSSTNKNRDASMNSTVAGATEEKFDPPTCTKAQLQWIEMQLPPDLCLKSHKRPFLNRCSFSEASGCPDTPWLEHHLSRPTETEEVPFLSFFVGCNKAIDAVHALRIGSRNPKFDVQQWKTTLAKGGDFTASSCDQFKKSYEPPGQEAKVRPAQLHCFEPVSSTFAQLQRTKQEMGWGNELILEEAAVSSQSGSLFVPKTVALGEEKTGIDHMSCVGENCRLIPIHTLNDYVASMPTKAQIQYLSIDVEGYDLEVLKGASNILKERVHYLEFEYNWKGRWGQQKLSEAISMLHDQHGFICYWPGPRNGHIWRITGCWLDHYDLRFWSNVACVNGNIAEARPLAEEMESNFLQTIQTEGVIYKGLYPSGSFRT